MKTITAKLRRLKSASSEFFSKHLNEISTLAVTSVAAFLVIVAFHISNSIEKDELMRENSELMIQNLMLDYRDKKRVIIMDRQQMYIRELEDFRKAVLKGNWTQNENTKQNKLEMVGKEQQVGDLGL
jgi:hypothetical protein